MKELLTTFIFLLTGFLCDAQIRPTNFYLSKITHLGAVASLMTRKWQWKREEDIVSSAKYGFEGSTKLKLSENIGFRIGSNTGFSMNEGRLKKLIHKTLDPATNSNIKPYKHNLP